VVVSSKVLALAFCQIGPFRRQWGRLLQTIPLKSAMSSEQREQTSVAGADLLARLELIEQRLQGLHEGLLALQAINQRLVEEVATLRQGQSSHGEAVTRLEREVRRGRWLRRVGAIIRLLILLGIIAGVLYYLGDWINWQNFFQLFV
jgi:hypothetical protein